MQIDVIEQLAEKWIDQYVVVAADRPDLARFKNMVGQVKAINMNGRALVQFDADNNRGRYDLDPGLLTIVDKPAPKAVEKPVKPAAKPAAKAPTG